jgi:hypothetical protein
MGNIIGRIIHSIVADVIFSASLLAPFDKVPHCFGTVATFLILYVFT